ncbi:hypothetical protein BGX27_005326, partial [Mortierella sp. AM989]
MTKVHQAATLTVGSVAANISRVNNLSQAEKTAIGKVIQDCVNVGNFIKREAHFALALYIKQEGSEGLENIRLALLNKVESNDMETDEEGDEDQGDEFGRGDTSNFFRILLTNICNGTNPKCQNNRATLDSIMNLYFEEFPSRKGAAVFDSDQAIIPVVLSSSIGNAIAVQYKRYFKETSAGNNSSLPLAPIRNGFILLTERELLRMLWKNTTMKKHLQKKLNMENSRDAEVKKVLKDYAPGAIINMFLTPIGLGPIKDSKSGYQRQTTTMTPDDMKRHLEILYGKPSDSELSDDQSDGQSDSQSALSEDQSDSQSALSEDQSDNQSEVSEGSISSKLDGPVRY